MRFHLIAALVAAVTLSACTTTGTTPAPGPSVTRPPVPAGQTQIGEAAQKALYAAEAAYNVPADAYVRLDRAKALTPTLKAQVRPMLQQAYRALLIGRQAAAAGDTAGVMIQAAEVHRWASAAKSLLPSK